MSRYPAVVVLLFFCAAGSTQTRPIGEIRSAISQSRQDTGRIRLLIKAATYYMPNANPGTHALDSLTYFSEQALNLSRNLMQPKFEGIALYLCAYKYRMRSAQKEGMDCIQKSIAILSRYGTLADLGEAYMELGNYYNKNVAGDLAPKIDAYGRAESLFQQAGDKQRYASALAYKGDVYSYGGDAQKSIDSLEKALHIYEQNHFSDIYTIYDLIGMKYGEQSDFTRGIRYSMQAAASMEAKLDADHYDCGIYYSLGQLYAAYGEVRQARIHLNKAMAIALKNKSPLRFGISQSIVSSYSAQNLNEKAIEMVTFFERTLRPVLLEDRLALATVAFTCYINGKNYPMAKKYEQELLQGFAAYSITDVRQANIYAFLIMGYIESGRYKDAKKFAGYYEVYNKHYKSPMGLRSAYLWLSEAETGLKDYRSALMHFQMATVINDSVYKVDKDNEISALMAQYEARKKQQDIQLLTKQSQLDKTQLAQVTLTRNIIFGGAGMLALMLALGVNRYRLKQRVNRQLEAQQQEINRKNESLERLVSEKEWLIKEIHHRVKNNLQIVMSLLNSQSLHLDSEDAIAAIRESQHRMQAMSLIHQKLYQSENVATVDMQSYIRELVDYLRDSLDSKSGLQFVQQVAPVKLDVAQAIPVGLILNEAITNAIKYAFPNGSQGEITVVMSSKKGNNMFLSIVDNGIGLSDDIEGTKKGSLGMSLMKGLASQLGGTLLLRNDDGLRVELEFPYFTGADTV